MSKFDVQSPLPSRKPILEEDSSSTPLVLPEKRERVEQIDESLANVGVAKPREKRFSLPTWSIWALIGLVVLMILGVFFTSLLPSLRGKPVVKQKILTYWGLWEESSIVSGILEDFESKNPGVKVNYKMLNKKDYRSRLQARLGKTGSTTEEVPDVFRIHSSWLPMFSGELAKVPTGVAGQIGLDSDFYKVFSELKVDGSYMAVPLMYDGLALFYNKDMLESAQASVPKTWWGLEKLARKLTVRDSNGQISRAGVALGLTANVDHWSDIVGLLMRQNGIDPYSSEAKNIDKMGKLLQFYAYFKTKDPVWDDTFAQSHVAFAQGKVAMIFAPSWRVFDIEAINPKLNFEVTSVPQLPTLDGADLAAIESGEVSGSLTDFQWSTYWVEGVNQKSPNQELAWQLVKFMADKEQLIREHTAASQMRSFGPIYPRKSMRDQMVVNRRTAPFVAAADNATGWYLSSYTYDAGVNDEMIKYFEDAINKIVAEPSSNVADTMSTLSSGISQLRQKYRLTKNLRQ